MEDKDPRSMDRREFLRKAAIAGGVAWAVPIIQTVAATPASAQTSQSPLACIHSPDANCPHQGNCKDACAVRAQQECGKDCGGGCEAVCNVQCPVGAECRQCTSTNACNPNCFDVTSCAGSCTVVFTC